MTVTPRASCALAVCACVVASGCGRGSGGVTIGTSLAAPRVSAELVVARSDGGLTLLDGSGGRIGILRRPGSLHDDGSPSWSPDGRQVAFTADTTSPSSGDLKPPTDVY